MKLKFWNCVYGDWFYTLDLNNDGDIPSCPFCGTNIVFLEETEEINKKFKKLFEKEGDNLGV
jgi:hypothetical protein